MRTELSVLFCAKNITAVCFIGGSPSAWGSLLITSFCNRAEKG